MAWYDGAWGYRKPLTIDKTEISGASHSDFPFLCNDNDSDLNTKAQGDGDDILYTLADGVTKLDHEIESYAAGVIVSHARIPTLLSATNPIIYRYYGNLSVGPQENPTGVWDSNFKLVNHMTPTLLDSTSNNNDGVNGGTADIAAKIGRGRDFELSDPDTLSFPDSADWDSSDKTLEFWLNVESQGSLTQTLFDRRQSGAGGWMMNLIRNNHPSVPSRLAFFIYNGGGVSASFIGTTTIVTGVDYYIRAVDNGGAIEFFVNEVSQGTASGTNGASNEDFLFGGDIIATEYLDGVIDEIRYSDSIRSDDWCATTRNNQNAPGTFYSVGAEESGPVFSTLNRVGGVLDRTASAVLVRVPV